jgi:glycosyltransferase involved in cell wall biosynthesis
MGAGVYTCALAGGLAQHGDVDLHVLARRDDGDRWVRLAPGAEVHAVVPNRRPARLVWEQTAAAVLASRVRPAVWHGPHYTMPLLGRVPAVVTIHDLTFFDHPEWHERSKVLYFRRMIRASARRAAALVCVSGHTARRLRALIPSDADVFVIPHGVDHERFAPSGSDVDDLRALTAHGITPPFIAFVSTLEPRKGVPTLLAAFARLAPAHPDLRLALVGADGWGIADIRNAIATHHLATRVIRPGYLPDAVIPALYRRAAAVASPSLEEGFGVPALEALACGAPLVTTTGSALEEVVGDAALTVPPGESEALADALARVLGDAELERRLRIAGPRRAEAFSWARAVDAHVDVYKRVVARS